MKLADFPNITFTSSQASDGNMSIYRGNLHEVIQNKIKFFKKISINPKNVVELKQIHGNKIVRIDKQTNEIKDADGLVTNKTGIYLMIKAADCHQIAFYDPRNQALATTV